MQKVRKKDYIVSLPNLIEPPWFWCGRRVHRCSLITGRSPTLIPVPFLLTNIKQQKLLQNQTHMKSIQKKNFMKKNVFFWIEIKRKVGFFLSLSSLFKKKKWQKPPRSHTPILLPISVSLSLNLCCQLFPPNNDFQRFFRGLK
jgi:hypothetical protein